jgi:predicted nucleic acid-binding protein
MRVLVDTCVLSEVQRPRPEPTVLARLASISHTDVFISAITFGELVIGIERLASGKRRYSLESWLSQIERLHAQRILPVDLEVGRIWGEVTARAAKVGRVVPATDGLIAATAFRHGLHVMTRNTPDFQATGVLLIDPWSPPGTP